MSAVGRRFRTFRTRLWLPALLCVLALWATVTLAASARAVIGLPAAVVDVEVPVERQEYRTFDADGTPMGTTTWRVAAETGNCCENYLATTPQGRLLDFGGTYPYLSDDEGASWQRVEPDTPLITGEGTISYAPNGDVVGIGWDPYSGDHLQAFKYDAAQDQWLWAEQPLHTPFYDREWVAVVPGPVEVDGETVPYAVILRGGYPTKDVYLISGDGLTYTEISSKQVEADMRPVRTDLLDPSVSAFADFGQTVQGSNVAPLGEGLVMTGPDLLTFADDCGTQTYLAGEDLRWACYEPDGAQPVQWQAVDSDGRLHATTWSPGDGSVAYLTSDDGGATVHASQVPLPEGFEVLGSSSRDIKANAEAGVVAITLHATNLQTDAAPSQDFVFVYRLQGGEPPVLDRIHHVGLGDLPSGAGVDETGARFDFSTVAILPDGRVAVSFNDSEHTEPAVAVQLTGAPSDDPTEQPTEDPTQEPTEAPSPEPSEEPSPEPTEDPSEEPTEEPSPEPTEDPSEEPVRAAEIERVAGPGRIDTAVRVSQERGDSADSVVLARADVYADALSGAPVAADLDAPILLTSGDALSEATAAEIDRLGARRVVLLGGTGAVSDDVADQLRADGLAVSRIGGANRFATAGLLAAALVETDADTRAFVVEGSNTDVSRGWPDAVSAGPYAAFRGSPILLVTRDEVPAETLQALQDQGVTETVVVGGPAAISDGVVADLAAAGHEPRRLAGGTRYGTSAAVFDEAVGAGMDPARLWLATGRDWPDALTAGPTVAALGEALLLVDGLDLDASPPTRDAIADRADSIERIRIVGGPNTIRPAVADAVRGLLE